MVEPMSREERDAGNRKIQTVFVLIVTLTPPLILLQGDPSLLLIVGAAGAGLLLGLLFVWYLRRLSSEFFGGRRI